MTPSNQEKQLLERQAWAVRIAREAGNLTLTYFRTPRLEVDRKEDDSPVTIADKLAEKLLRDRIEERYPADGIVGEELNDKPCSSGFTWILDPIDGTKSFIHGIPLYTTLVAVLRTPGNDLSKGEPMIGVIRAPALDEEVYAMVGQGAWYRRGDTSPEPAKVSQTSQISEGLLVTSEVFNFCKYRTPDATDVFIELQRQARLARTWGDGYGYLMVATGRAEAAVDPIVNLWDVASLQPIIEEAGGIFGDWQGNPTVHSGDSIATNNRAIMDEVLKVTRGR